MIISEHNVCISIARQRIVEPFEQTSEQICIVLGEILVGKEFEFVYGPWVVLAWSDIVVGHRE